MGSELGGANQLNFRAFERTLRARNRSDGTIASYHQAVTDIAEHHAGRDLMELKQTDVEDYLGERLRTLAATTVAIRFRSLRAFYNWAVGEEIIDRSPMARLVETKVTDKPTPVLPDEDLITLLKTCGGKLFEDRRDTAIIRLFCEPGSPRVAEMARLLVADLDMQKDLVKLHGKGDKIRVIPFGAKTGQAFDRYLRMRMKHRLAASPRLWLGVKGTEMTPSGVAKMLSRRSAQSGVGHIHPHQLRHTSAHTWADNGGSEGDAMALFGWSSAEMPRRYGRSASIARAHRASRRMSLGDRL